MGASFGGYVTYEDMNMRKFSEIREHVLNREFIMMRDGETLTMETVQRVLREIGEETSRAIMTGTAPTTPKRGGRAIALDGKF
jgi:hypothetical protein